MRWSDGKWGDYSRPPENVVPVAGSRSPGHDWLRVLRIVAAAAVLSGGPLMMLLVSAIGHITWASPDIIRRYDLRPYPGETLDQQLQYCRLPYIGWAIVWFSGILLVGRWSDRLQPAARAAIVALPAVLGLAMLTLQGSEFSPRNPTPIASVEGLGRLVKMRFPPGTQLIEAKAAHALDWTVAAKLRMPKHTVMPFIQGPFIDRFTEQSEYYRHAQLGISRSELYELTFAEQCGMADWHPERLKRFVCADVSGVGQYIDTLVADMSEPSCCTVYFVFAVF